MYEDGFLRVDGNYSKFLEGKEAYLHAKEGKRRGYARQPRPAPRSNGLRIRGPKGAHHRVGKARITTARKMIGGVGERWTPEAPHRNRADRFFRHHNRQTKQLIGLDAVSCAVGDRTLFRQRRFQRVTSGMRVGLEWVPMEAARPRCCACFKRDRPLPARSAKRIPLRVVYFDQKSPARSGRSRWRRALAPDSDAVVYSDAVVHVASWAARFLFSGESEAEPAGRAGFTGGERARILIAQLMLQPADLLLLDEPTNDLDIPTLEVLEEGLLGISWSACPWSRTTASHARKPRLDGRPRSRRPGRDRTLCRLFAMGRLAAVTAR